MLDKIASSIGKFCYRYRKVISVFFAVLFLTVLIVQTKAQITYTYVNNNKLTKNFEPENILVVIYDNKDEDNLDAVLDYLSADEHVTSVRCYKNTLGMPLDASALSSALGLDESIVKALLYIRANGYETSGMTIKEFAEFLCSDYVMGNPMIEGMLDSDSMEMLNQYLPVLETNPDETVYSAAELAAIFGGDTFPVDEGLVNFLMLYHDGVNDNTQYTASIYDFFDFLISDIATNPAISGMFAGGGSEGGASTFIEASVQMRQGKAMMIGKNHSRMIISVDYVPESKEMEAFFNDCREKMDEAFEGDFHFVGNAAMSDELCKTFHKEYTMISLIIAVAIFIVICVTFRKWTIPLLLVCVIQCAVFITMSVMVITHSAMYFIALIIVQAILMGSMVDYGILLTSYYIEVRKELKVKDALPEVLKRSASAILTSALIMVSICFILGNAIIGPVGGILTTLGTGSASAIILVLFILPSLLAVFDKWLVKEGV